MKAPTKIYLAGVYELESQLFYVTYYGDTYRLMDNGTLRKLKELPEGAKPKLKDWYCIQIPKRLLFPREYLKRFMSRELKGPMRWSRNNLPDPC